MRICRYATERMYVFEMKATNPSLKAKLFFNMSDIV